MNDDKRALGGTRPGIAKRLAFSLVATAIFFLGVEVILWLAGVHTLLADRDPFLGFSKQVRVYELDPQRGVYRTPPRAVEHSFNYQEFLAEKPADGYRVFVIGGSSAYGFPWGGAVAFPHLLEEALRAGWPDRTIEVVNAAAMSYGSHRLRILTDELLQYEPDLLIVYGGHNEFVERRFYSEFLDRPEYLDRPKALLDHWRLFSLMTRLRERLTAPDRANGRAGDPRGDVGGMLGLDVDREYSEDIGQAEVTEVTRHFRENLSAIVSTAERAGVKVILCTVPSNLSGWLPNESFFTSETAFENQQEALSLLAEARAALKSQDAAAAIELLERARGLAPRYAEIHFRLGQAYEMAGRPADARASYVRARDTDGMPGRAVSSINDTIRDLGETSGALLLDAEHVFESASPDGLIGFNLIEDYVHPKPEGHRLIAYELWKLVLEQGLLGEARVADPEEFRAAVATAPEDTASSEGEDAIARAKTPTMLFNLGVVMENQGLLDEAMDKYRACLKLEPRHAVARTNLGLLLNRKGMFREAEEQFRQAVETMPTNVDAMVGLGEALRNQQRLAEAERVLTQATATDAGSASAWDRLGVVRSQLGRYTEAESALRKAVSLDPDEAEHQADLGYALLFQGKLQEAREAFRTSVTLRPDRVRGRDGLAAVFLQEGDLDQAEKLFRDSLRVDPQDGFARNGLAEVEKQRGR